MQKQDIEDRRNGFRAGFREQRQSRMVEPTGLWQVLTRTMLKIGSIYIVRTNDIGLIIHPGAGWRKRR